ncbi:MAG TPA: hypothetical protein EYO99_03690 [Candidatus Marinimicrobia bacterium]|nr:hypothetical protein [Candidatus Neomarinimicrobiota bacterium]
MGHPKWLPIIADALKWIKDAKQFEKQYRKDCTDYDGAMESYTKIILDCARNLDSASVMLNEWESSQFGGT